MAVIYLSPRHPKEIPIDLKNKFIVRTNNHIRLVIHYCKRLMEYVQLKQDPFFHASLYEYQNDQEQFFNSLILTLKNEANYHDRSKFSRDEFIPYVINWAIKYYKNNDDTTYQYRYVTDQTICNEAWLHHQHVNKHHSGYYLFYKKKMPIQDILTMIGDHAAVSTEVGKLDDLVNYEKTHFGDEGYQFSNEEKEFILRVETWLQPEINKLINEDVAAVIL
jgi:hypothetical protein